MVGGTRTLTGGFDTVVTGFGPETEGIEAVDGRRMGPVGFLTAFKVTAVSLVSSTSDLVSANGPG